MRLRLVVAFQVLVDKVLPLGRVGANRAMEFAFGLVSGLVILKDIQLAMGEVTVVTFVRPFLLFRLFLNNQKGTKVGIQDSI